MFQMEQSAVSLEMMYVSCTSPFSIATRLFTDGCSTDLAISVSTATIHHLHPIMTKLCIDTKAKKSYLAVLLD